MSEVIRTGDAVDAPPGTATFYFREGTQDKIVFEEVYVNNQYRLPEKLPEGCLVLDIGANIGTFAVACLMRGAGTVVCFEPSLENFKTLGMNLSSWPEQTASFRVGVWRSDKTEKIVFIHGPGTCQGCCQPEGATEIPYQSSVPAIGLDEIISQCTNDGEIRVNLLKVDAEYSEYPILYTCTKLHLVDEIIGETHELFEIAPSPEGDVFHDCNAKGMKAFLEGEGFVVEQHAECDENNICTLFFAKRRSTPGDNHAAS